MSTKLTKQGNLTQEFLRRAASNPTGALATMFLAAFGVSMEQLLSIVKAIIDGKSAEMGLFMMAMAASVQIRNHVVFVGRDFARVKERFPFMIIEGSRSVQDVFNFGAFHALGHLLCALHGKGYGEKVTKKSGNCVSGESLNDSEAGKINAEIYNSWSESDRDAYKAAKAGFKVDALKDFFTAIDVEAAKFSKPEAAPPSASIS